MNTNRREKRVSVLVPCRNEIDAINNCLENLLNFDPPEGGYEVIIIDGMSDDGTREEIIKKVKKYPNLKMIDNKMRTIPHAMNLGIKEAEGVYIIRTDVRCIHPKSYLKDLIDLSEQTNADNVGGVLEPVGNAYIQKGIAIAYKSPIAMGGALRDRGDFIGETDAVYGGCWKKKRIVEIGMYDESMIKNEDDELSFRLRKSGGKVMQSGKIKVKYFPRKNFMHLFKQFMQYGYWKVPVLKKHPKQASARHLAPTLLVLGFLVLGLLAFFNQYFLLGLKTYTGSYFVILLSESLRLSYKENLSFFPLVLLSIATIQFAYGIGFFISLLCELFDTKPKWFESLTR